MISKTKTTIAVLATAAIAAPSAAARPADSAAPVTTAHAATRTVAVPSTGFDWTDAGLGAAGTLSLLALGASAVVVGRRRHPTIS
jgi:hypothetical protein